MCELFALSASAPVEIKLSPAELARHGGQTGIHADGWGVAFLEGRDVRLIREPSAAAFSPWVQCLQDHPIQSNTVNDAKQRCPDMARPLCRRGVGT